MPMIDLSETEDLSGLSPLWEINNVEGYRFVLYSGFRMVVYKGDSQVPAYEVGPDGCNCPAAQYGNVCKHASAALYVGDGRPVPGSSQLTKAPRAEHEASQVNVMDLL